MHQYNIRDSGEASDNKQTKLKTTVTDEDLLAQKDVDSGMLPVA